MQEWLTTDHFQAMPNHMTFMHPILFYSHLLFLLYLADRLHLTIPNNVIIKFTAMHHQINLLCLNNN